MLFRNDLAGERRGRARSLCGLGDTLVLTVSVSPPHILRMTIIKMFKNIQFSHSRSGEKEEVEKEEVAIPSTGRNGNTRRSISK